MISKEDIITLARLSHLRPHQQEKIYLQMHILNSLYSNYKLAFKGGTCLMFVSQLPRFSEDLDFTQTDPKASLHEMAQSICSDLELLGFQYNLKLIHSHEMGHTYRFGIEGPLFKNEKDRCYIRLDISQREPVYLPLNFRYISPNIPDLMPFGVYVLDPSEIMAEKIRAVMTRHQARDVFDLYYLIQKNISTNQGLIQQKLNYYNQTWDYEQFKEKLIEKETYWEAELSPIVIGQLPSFSSVQAIIEQKIEI